MVSSCRRFVCACLLGAVLTLDGVAFAQGTAELIAIQGQIDPVGSSTLADGIYRARVTLFDSETAGTAVFTETFNEFPVANSRFTILIGSETPLPPAVLSDNTNLWAEIQVDLDNAGLASTDPFVPRTPIYAVPVARYAAQAGSLTADLAGTLVTVADFGADQAAQNMAIAQKADVVDVDAADAALGNSIALKADAADVAAIEVEQAAQDALIAQKADQTSVDVALARKVDQQSEAYWIVEVSDDPAVNGANLLVAYADAVAASTPYGEPRSRTNRVTVLVPPGRYDLGTGSLTLSEEFVDLVGLSTSAEAQYIFGLSNGPGTGVLEQTANDVRIANLTVECTRVEAGLPSDPEDVPAAYFPSDLALTGLTEVTNCVFVAQDFIDAYSMRARINYPGRYTDVTAGSFAFGGRGGVADGDFIRCRALDNAFGSGGSDGGPAGVASGFFEDCIGDAFCFGSGAGSIAAGTFVRCRSGSFGFGSGGGQASGKFEYCVAGTASFGSSVNDDAGIASGSFIGCEGGSSSFGNGSGSLCSGSFINCVGGQSSFGGSTATVSTAAEFINCRNEGSNWGGVMLGRMDRCLWSGGLVVGDGGRVYQCTVNGNVTLQSGAAMARTIVTGSINSASPLLNLDNVAGAPF